MKIIKKGNIVARKSYGGDIFFKVTDILNKGNKKTVLLKGINCRIQADAPESDVYFVSENSINKELTVEKSVENLYNKGK